MTVRSGVVTIAAVNTPQFAFTMGPTGAMVQNQHATSVLTLGPPTMAAQVGPTLPAAQATPVVMPGGIAAPSAAETAAATDDVWVSGTVTGVALAWLTNL